MRVLVVSDTHLSADRIQRLPAAVWSAARSADVILHAGDVTSTALLEALGERAPVHAVLGNNDRGLERILPDRVQLELDGVPVALVHDSGPRKARAGRMRRWFPDASVVVFGHSHIPVNEPGDGGQLLFNPGSPTQRRRQPQPTFGLLNLARGLVRSAEIVAIR